MENNLAWTKTILSVYRYLERICGAIDKIILNTGLSSRNVSLTNYFRNDALSVSQKIIDLSQRKVSLINLKLLTEQCLKKIKTDDARLLILCYIDGMKRRELADKFGISMRTIFRRIDAAESSFAKMLHLKGYTDSKLAEDLKNENWIKSVFSKYSKGEEQERIELSSSYINRAVAM